jgi:hypothetical protein
LLATIIVFETLQKIRARRVNKNTYGKLSIMDQQVVSAVGETQGTPTPDNIAATYQNMVHREITTNDLTQKLAQAEKTGLVERSLFNYQDQPLLVYKTNVPHSTTAHVRNKLGNSTKTPQNQPQTSLKHQKKEASASTSNDIQAPDKCLSCPELLQCAKRKAPRNESLTRNCTRNWSFGINPHAD